MGKYATKTCRLLTMLGLTASFFLVEIVVGYVTNSIALVADSFHMLSDVVALIIGFASVRMSKWPSKQNTFGWARAEVLGAMINSVFLIALCFSIMVEALKRLIQIEEVQDPKLLLIVGSVGLLVNVIGLFLFHDHGHSHGGGGHGHSHGSKKGHGHSHGKNGDDHQHNGDCSGHHEDQALVEQVKASDKTNGAVTELTDVIIDDAETKASMKVASSSQLNMRGVFLHVLGDALGSVIVVISSLVIWFGEGDWKYYVDPAMSLAMVIIILSTSIPLLKDSSRILLQTVPSHIEVQDISKKIMEIEGVMHVHELHIWQLAGSRIIASAHIRCHDPESYMKIGKDVKDLFHNEGIHSTTIQPEFEPRKSILNPFDKNVKIDPIDRDCVFECGPDKTCHLDTCCGKKAESPARYIQPVPSLSDGDQFVDRNGETTEDKQQASSV